MNDKMIVIALLLQLLGLLCAVLNDPYIHREKRKLFLMIIVLSLSLVAQNYAEYRFDIQGEMPYARLIVSICGYCIRPAILALFCLIVHTESRNRFVRILIGINTLVHLTALFSDICFTIDEENRFMRGPLGYTCHIVSGILLTYLVWLTYREYRNVRKSDTIILIINVAVIAASVVADMFIEQNPPATYLTVAVVTGDVFYYIWLHLRFVREHEEDLKAQQRIRIMMSQIRPHFVYNTLSTIQALCETDPHMAKVTVEKFGSYLRQNVESLNRPELIPFEKEWEHTRTYTDIEKLRFENIRVEYDIRDTDFSLPALTVQPLVENAIRHGVRIREEGIVRVIARDRGDFHEIVIQDNGKGFDVRKIEEADDTHIGIRNVRERIETMCKGSMVIESSIGEGTIITIRIPEQNAGNDG